MVGQMLERGWTELSKTGAGWVGGKTDWTVWIGEYRSQDDRISAMHRRNIADFRLLIDDSRLHMGILLIFMVQLPSSLVRTPQSNLYLSLERQVLFTSF